MDPTVQWAVIGAAGVVAMAMLARGLWRLRAGAAPEDRPPASLDVPGGLSKIERIKRYREQHGVGLKEAKDAVEAEMAGEPKPAPVRPAAAPPRSIEALVDAGQLIEAIKLYRETHKVGLKQAKEAIDAIRNARR